MPYIQQEERVKFDSLVNELVQKLTEEDSDFNPGQLNYVISSLLTKLLYVKKSSYARLNSLIGAIECVKLEFYRKKLGPYEDVKESINGSV